MVVWEWGTERAVTTAIALTVGVVALGALAQRLTGMGFALVSAPFLVLLLGPREGVILANLASAGTAALVLSRVITAVEWRTYAWLVVPALIGIVPGALLATRLDSSWLELCIGSFLVLALLVSIFARHTTATSTGAVPRVAAGFVSGFSSAAAGISGPPISLYAVLARWPQQAFAATVQPYFLTLGLTSVIAKLLLDPSEWPQLPVWLWLLLIVALVAGISLGELVSKRVPVSVARTIMLTLAILGALAVALHGMVTLGTG